MKKGLVLVIIQLIVVGAVLALTVVSFAWFTANMEVGSQNVRITSEKSSEVSLVIEPDDFVPYKGETGQGYNDPSRPDLILDVPYKVIKKFTMTCRPTEKYTDYAFCAYFSSINIEKNDGEVIDITKDTEIMKAFTFRFHVYRENGDELAVYAPEAGSNFVVLTNGETGTIGSYLIIDKEVTLKCGFELVFLDEASYANWLKENYLDVTAFRYCDLEFMRAMFNITFRVGMDIPQE